jgi:hypothetical protein
VGHRLGRDRRETKPHDSPGPPYENRAEQPAASPGPFFQRRAGISLLEIMFSIGIVGIGLIGVAALIPLAHHKAAQGIQEDRKTLFGKRAFREFRVRGMDRPGSSLSPRWFWTTPRGQQPYDGLENLIRRVYCLDPMMVAAALGQGNNLYTFPAATQTRPADWMVPRLNLVHSPAELSSAQPVQMTLAQAQEVFALRDDLTMQRSANQDQPPWLGYLSRTSGGRRIATKMLAGGGYSWMATLVPQPLDVGDEYTLSVVIIRGRNLTLPIPEEVTAQVVSAGSMMVGMVKDLRLRQLAPTVTPSEDDFGLDKLRQGDWIALMQGDYPNPQMLKWYRVTAVDQPDNSGDRIATLDGPDWNVNLNFPLYAIYLRGVVAVYDKTIRLHDSTVYTQDLPPI